MRTSLRGSLRILVLPATLACLALAAGGLSAANGDAAIPLSAGQEPDGGEPGGHGFFSYTIDGTEFCWTLSWRNIDDPFAGHVHVAPRGVAGPVVIPLDVDGVAGPDTSGCTTIDPAPAGAITADPSAYYVNLHTEEFPAGVIRGQLK